MGDIFLNLFCAFIESLHQTVVTSLMNFFFTVPICIHTYFRGFNTMLMESGHILCQALLMSDFLNSMMVRC